MFLGSLSVKWSTMITLLKAYAFPGSLSSMNYGKDYYNNGIKWTMKHKELLHTTEREAQNVMRCVFLTANRKADNINHKLTKEANKSFWKCHTCIYLLIYVKCPLQEFWYTISVINWLVPNQNELRSNMFHHLWPSFHQSTPINSFSGKGGHPAMHSRPECNG